MTGFFLRGHAPTAVVAVNDGKQFRRGQRLLGQTLDTHALANLVDPAVDLRRLAAHPPPSAPETAPGPADAPEPATTLTPSH